MDTGPVIVIGVDGTAVTPAIAAAVTTEAPAAVDQTPVTAPDRLPAMTERQVEREEATGSTKEH